MTRSPAARREEAVSAFNHLPSPTTGSTSPTVAPTISSPEFSKPAAESGPWIKSGGFFGPTNFSAVFLENKESLGNEDIQISNDGFENPHESIQSQQTILMLAGTDYRGSPRVALGVKILRSLPDKATCNFLLEWYFEKCHECTFHKPSVMATASSLWTTFGEQFKEPRRLDDLEEISAILCKNNETALPEYEDYEPWLDSFTGIKLRWESLGSVLGALTTATLSLPERDAFFCTQRGTRSNRKQFAVEMKDCVQACVTLSNYQDLINIQMVSLLVKNLILQTVISGDTSKLLITLFYSTKIVIELANRSVGLATVGRPRKRVHSIGIAPRGGESTNIICLRTEKTHLYRRFQHRQRLVITHRPTPSIELSIYPIQVPT